MPSRSSRAAILAIEVVLPVPFTPTTITTDGSPPSLSSRWIVTFNEGGELRKLQDAFGWGLDDFEWLTINAMKSAFAPFPERLGIIDDVIKPRYARLRAEAVSA